MKKFVSLFFVALLVCIMLCSCDESSYPTSSDVKYNPHIATNTIDSDAPSFDYVINGGDFSFASLCRAFLDGTWDGSFVYNKSHCASIDSDGTLWIDNVRTFKTIDMPLSDTFNMTHVLFEKCEIGTYVVNQEDGRLELYKNGELLSSNDWIGKFPVTRYQLSDDLFIFQDGMTLSYWKAGEEGIISEQVIDSSLIDGKVRYSTLDHIIYQLDETTFESTVVDSGVHFKSFNAIPKVTTQEDYNLYQLLKEAYLSGDWDGENIQVSSLCTDENKALYSGIFARISTEQEIFVNNELKFFLGADGYYYTNSINVYNTANLDKSSGKNCAYILTIAEHGLLSCFADTGLLFSVDIPQGNCEILGVTGYADDADHTQCTISIKIDKSIYLVTVQGDNTTIHNITNNAVDACMAYDYVYWISDDYLTFGFDILDLHGFDSICPKAYAVCIGNNQTKVHFIVAPEIANCEDTLTGFSNLYSPYA